MREQTWTIAAEAPALPPPSALLAAFCNMARVSMVGLMGGVDCLEASVEADEDNASDDDDEPSTVDSDGNMSTCFFKHVDDGSKVVSLAAMESSDRAMREVAPTIDTKNCLLPTSRHSLFS